MQYQLPLFENIKRTATFSDCGQYRYSLQRNWAPNQRNVVFIGLNPSTADSEVDDPTIRRCIRFAHSWGFGGMSMANLFAYRSTDPKMLLNVSDPVGPENDEWLVQLSQSASLVIAAWGNHGCYLNRSESVKRLCGNLHVIKLNGSGEPAHPLYLPAYLTPQRWL